jgi:hypothetical protein
MILLLLSLTSQQVVHAQCTTTINSFPYMEGFEANNGNWTPSSSAHWEWGTPVGKVEITVLAAE